MTLVHRIMDTFELFTAQQIAVSPVEYTPASVLDMEGLRMEEVAEQTGGVAYHNNNDIGSRSARPSTMAPTTTPSPT
jgi:hypothetical protein